jgi:hypothetical protein
VSQSRKRGESSPAGRLSPAAVALPREA